MAEVTKYEMELREVLEALIKQQNLHEGIWQLVAEFGLAAANINASTGTGEQKPLPSAIVPLKKLGIIKVEQESPLAVDAAKVNPK